MPGRGTAKQQELKRGHGGRLIRDTGASSGSRPTGFTQQLQTARDGRIATYRAGIGQIFEALADVHGDLSGSTGLGHAKIVRKTADETVNNSAVLQPDNELLFAIAANEVWAFEAWLIVNSSAVADFKADFTQPAGATGYFTWARVNDAGAIAIERSVFGTPLTLSGPAAARLSPVITGLCINGATAGSVTLQWAQNTAEVSDTKVLANSFLRAWRLA